MSLLRMYRTECIVFLVALIIRTIGVLAIAFFSSAHGVPFPVSGADSKGYMAIAQNLLAHGAFSRADAPPFVPDSFRTPGYPLFVALLLQVFGTPLAVVMAQITLSAGSAVVLYRLSAHYLVGRVRWVPVVFAILDPTSTYLAGVILSETLFGFLLLLSLSMVQDKRMTRIVASSVFLGFATLVRPVGLVALLCVVVFLYIRGRQNFLRVGIFLAVFGVVVFPWALRNYLLFGSWQLSHVGTYNFYEYHATLFYASQHGISHRSAINDVFHKTLEERYPSVEIGEYTLRDMPALRRVAWEYISDDIPVFIGFYILKTLPFLFTDGLTDVTSKIGISTPQPLNITSRLFHGEFLLVMRDLWDPLFLPFWIGVSVWFSVTIGMMMGVWCAWRSRVQNYFFIMLFTVVLLFALATGTVANARLRDPVAPLMFLLAAAGFSALRSLWHTHKYDRR